jgi:hypothetical protein
LFIIFKILSFGLIGFGLFIVLVEVDSSVIEEVYEDIPFLIHSEFTSKDHKFPTE